MPLEMQVAIDEAEIDIQNAQRHLDVLEEKFGTNIETDNMGIDVNTNPTEGGTSRKI
jgi:hypothetical protein